MADKPRHIWITGASSGIGRALALEYARDGVRLALSGRNQERLNDVAALCAKMGADVSTHVVDVTSQKDMLRLGERLNKDVPLDLVIANAGISGGTGSDPDGESVDQIRDIYGVNVYGVINTIEAALPSMLAANKGQIAIMSSLAGFQGWAGAPAYSSSKAAVRTLGEGLHGSLKDRNVHVSVICPGFVETPMTAINPFRMPFIISAEKAARIIVEGLEKRKVRIAFPLIPYLFAGFLGIMPPSWSALLLPKFPSKPKT